MLTLNSIIKEEPFKNLSVGEIIDNNRKDILSLIKLGYQFDDDVLSYAHIHKKSSEPRFKYKIVEHEKDDKTYQKDNVSLAKIINEINSIDN